MANSNQARKRARQASRRRILNYAQRSLLRTRIRQLLSALKEKDKDAAQSAYQRAVPVIDRMARKNIIHRNAAARYKSRLNKRVQALS